jgi:DNA-binding LytR/AlgR family response regulator
VTAATELIRVLVVEDERPARNYLVELLQSSGLTAVVGAVGSSNEARQVLECDGPAVDVVFVDVQLDGSARGETGLSLVRSSIGRATAPMFVLATAFEEHALEAFDLGVVDYLLKPFSEDRVAQCLRRLQQHRALPSAEARAPARIVARRKRSLVFLDAGEIWAFEAADRLTFVHATHGVFDLDLSLAAVEVAFGPVFLRVHRNWLVNAAHIKMLERDGHETKLFVGHSVSEAGTGVHVPVARERAATVREMLLANATGLRRA